MELTCSSIECACELHGVISGQAEIAGSLSSDANIDGSLSGASTLSGTVQIYNGTAPPDYEGAYEVTPTLETQTLPTENRRLVQDVIVNPIPEYYGLITWDGSVLTVS